MAEPSPFAAKAGILEKEASEEEAWARVQSAWEDLSLHRAYLARQADLAGLTLAGGRYRAVLAERPGDAVARGMRDEVVKRATALGLASLPRTRPAKPRKTKGRVLWFVALALGILLGLFAFRLATLLGARP